MRYVFVRRDGEDTGGTDLVLHAGQNLITGEAKFRSTFGAITSLEADLLLLGAAIFAADRAIPRGDREDQNRRISISLPIVNALRVVPLIPLVEDILHTFSHDYWRIELRESNGVHEGALPTDRTECGNTLLFSGGLDSFAAAVEYGRSEFKLQLVSHITRNPDVTSAQNRLFEILTQGGMHVFHHQFMVTASSVDPTPNISFEVESSQRTRSFLFLLLAALCARRRGHHKVVFLAENGQMAIHLPLNEARTGAFSTHTAHPVALRKVEQLLATVLNWKLEIVNPYQERTKAEVIEEVVRQFPAAIPVSISCWKSSRIKPGFTHCGICVPCIIRRVAIETHAPDQTAYQRDMLSEMIQDLDSGDDGRRNIYDVAMFTLMMEQMAAAELIDSFPELQTVERPNETIDMYKRAAAEVRRVFSAHPTAAGLLS